MLNVTFKIISEEDIVGVKSVATKAWFYTYGQFLKHEYIKQYIEKNYSYNLLYNQISRIKSSDEFFTVVLEDKEVIGFCNILNRSNEAELARLYLLPSFIGKGLGKQLLYKGELFIKTKGKEKYFCYVHKDNDLGQKFYLRNGFKYIPEKDLSDEINNDCQTYMEKELCR